MDCVVAAVLAITAFRWGQNLGRALEAGHQHGGANFHQSANDSFRPTFDAPKAANRAVNSYRHSGETEAVQGFDERNARDRFLHASYEAPQTSRTLSCDSWWVP